MTYLRLFCYFTLRHIYKNCNGNEPRSLGHSRIGSVNTKKQTDASHVKATSLPPPSLLPPFRVCSLGDTRRGGAWRGRERWRGRGGGGEMKERRLQSWNPRSKSDLVPIAQTPSWNPFGALVAMTQKPLVLLPFPQFRGLDTGRAWLVADFTLGEGEEVQRRVRAPRCSALLEIDASLFGEALPARI